MPAYSHTDISDAAAVREVVRTWSYGVLNADVEEVSGVIHEAFSTSVFTWTRIGNVLNRDQYLARIDRNSYDISNVVLRYANYERVGNTVQVSPIVVYVDKGTAKNTVTLTLQKTADLWQIIEVTTSFNLPAAWTESVIPERANVESVAIRVVDADTGHPIRARVNIRDSAGEYWPPAGHIKNVQTGFREDVGGDVKIDGTTFAYVDPEFALRVPVGSYNLEVVRGMEYEPQTVHFEVTASNTPDIEVRLERWSNLRAQGWYSADPHVHFLDPHTAKLELDGENLNVIGVLPAQFAELIVGVEHFTGRQSLLSEPERIVYVGEELRHSFLGHTVLHNLKQLIFPMTWGGPGNGVPGGFDYPPMAAQADKAHKQGALVSWAHFPFPEGELAADVVLGKVDAVELVMWTDPFDEARPLPAARTYYRLLNTGARLPVMGGTDKMMNTQVVGSVRTYVQVDSEFSYETWLDGIRAGRTFVTTGPMLMLSIADYGPGDVISADKEDVLQVRAEVNSRTPVDRIEIIQGGEIIAVMENHDRKRQFSFETEIHIDNSSWVVARAYSSKILPYQTWDFLGANGIPLLAHTSPVYIEVDGKLPRSAEDAAYLAEWCQRSIDWVKTKGNFRNDAEREEFLTLFERAKSIYLQQVNSEKPDW